MRNKPSGADDERAQTTAEQDAREECRVLREVLSDYPETLTLEELVRVLTSGSPAFSDEDAVRVAVVELIAAGLLRRHGDYVLPTRAAVVFCALMQEDEIRWTAGSRVRRSPSALAETCSALAAAPGSPRKNSARWPAFIELRWGWWRAGIGCRVLTPF
jgi:hypothetical protein